MKKLVLFVICLILPVLLNAQTNTPPDGWRFPGEADYAYCWKENRETVPVPFHARADFDGNGVEDDAWILLGSRGKKWGLFVFLGEEKGAPRVIVLEERSGQDGLAQSMGIQVVSPGNYDTVCGKGYIECSKDEPLILNLKRPAIDYYLCESANSFFWWDEKVNRFRRTWISD